MEDDLNIWQNRRHQFQGCMVQRMFREEHDRDDSFEIMTWMIVLRSCPPPLIPP
jgi:hypothetical protein